MTGDLLALHALWNDRAVRRFLFDDRPVPEGEAERLLAASSSSFEKHGYGLFVAFENATGALVGFAGLMESDSVAPNLVVGVVPLRWKQGLGAEAASLVLESAVKDLGLPEVRADVDEPNTASVRLVERLGFGFDRRAIVRGRPLLYYRLARERWRAVRGLRPSEPLR